MMFIGIDPGESGGIGCLDKDVDVFKMPETERDIWDVIWGKFYTPDASAFALIEKVGPMPKQGLSSTWKFSGNYHSLRMALIACGIPFEAVAPGIWQRAMGCLTKGDKNVTKRKAQELFPHIKVTHALADALLIMEYCRRTKS